MLQKPPGTILLITFLILLVLPVTASLPGRIAVSSTPSGALVCVDTKDCDITPATFLVEGNAWHMVVVTETGYRDWTETVYVTADMTSSANAYLDQDPAATAVSVNVTPGGGTVCLDNLQCRQVGTTTGTAGTLFTGVSPGYHTISVESPAGYENAMQLVQVELGKTTAVSITLPVYIPPVTTTKTPSVATGMVRVYVDRLGSTVCIDNGRCVYNVGGNPGPGTGTTFFTDIAANETHIVTVAADGYEPFAQAVTVEKDLIARVDAPLQAITRAGVTPIPATTAPLPVTTITLTTAPPQGSMPPTTRGSMNAVPALGALALIGIAFAFWRGRN